MREERVPALLSSAYDLVVDYIYWMEVEFLFHSLSIELSAGDIGESKGHPLFNGW